MNAYNFKFNLIPVLDSCCCCTKFFYHKLAPQLHSSLTWQFCLLGQLALPLSNPFFTKGRKCLYWVVSSACFMFVENLTTFFHFILLCPFSLHGTISAGRILLESLVVLSCMAQGFISLDKRLLHKYFLNSLMFLHSCLLDAERSWLESHA